MPKVILDWDQKANTAVIISDFLATIRAKFSVPNNNKKIMTRAGKPTWYMSDFISPITPSGQFDIGLYFEITNTLRSEEAIEYEIITTGPLQDRLIQTYQWNDNYSIASLNLPLRPYQESGVKRSIYMGYGILIVGTAGGKTLLMASLIQTIRKYQPPFTTIVVLPSNLVEQTYKEYIDYGIPTDDISIWSGDDDFKKASIILASAEILRAHLVIFSERLPFNQLDWITNKPKGETYEEYRKVRGHKKKITNEEWDELRAETYEEYVKRHAKKEKVRKSLWNARRKNYLKELSDVDLILIDEVHGVRRDNTINDVIKLFPTRHRFGFTGTMPSGILDQWNVIGKIGPNLINVDSAALREMNYIAQIKAQVIKLHYKDKPRFKVDPEVPTRAYDQECDFLYHNAFRNKVISYLTSKFDKNCLIIVDSLDHGKTIEALLKQQTDKQVYFIQGSVEMEDREKLRALMEIDNNIICIAMSRIFAVGINIKNLHYIIFAQSGKAKVTIIQSIGRGLRLHEQKECLVLIDIADATHYGELHLEERLAYYKAEQIENETKDLFE